MGKLRSWSIYEAAIRRLGRFRLITSPGVPSDQLLKCGLSSPPVAGDAVLPSVLGPVSDFNANGKTVVRKDLPKEPQHRMVWATWNDWHGQSHSGLQMRTYKVYPKDFTPGPEEHIFCVDTEKGTVVSSRVFSVDADSADRITHALNLFLELFGEVHIAGEDYSTAHTVPIRRLNWKILPAGEYPFSRAVSSLQEFTAPLDDNVRPVVVERIRAITQFKPDFLAVGRGGFSDYVVFGFTGPGVYVFESPSLGNATYVFTGDWAALSLLTKKQIIEGELHKARIIHNRGWAHGLRTAIRA